MRGRVKKKKKTYFLVDISDKFKILHSDSVIFSMDDDGEQGV